MQTILSSLSPHRTAPRPRHRREELADARKATEEAIATEARAADSKREAEARWVSVNGEVQRNAERSRVQSWWANRLDPYIGEEVRSG